MEMILTGETKTAAEMYTHGLVNKVVPPGQALEGALELARIIARNRPSPLKAAKEIAFRSAAELWSDADGWKKQQEPSRAVMQSEDLQEGLRAFAEKRDAVWKGRLAGAVTRVDHATPAAAADRGTDVARVRPRPRHRRVPRRRDRFVSDEELPHRR